MVAGGYDVLCRFVMRGFDALRSLTRDEVRPFDRRRSGLLLGEAGALVLLVRERDAAGPRLGTLLGYGSASDGFHIAAPDPEGRGLERAIRAALADAPRVARATSTSSARTAPPRRSTTGSRRPRSSGCSAPRAHEVPVNSIKGGLGHTMGAAAALEAFMCLLSAQRGLIPPTLHLDEPDPECELDHVPGQARAGATAHHAEHLPRLRRLQRRARARGAPDAGARDPRPGILSGRGKGAGRAGGRRRRGVLGPWPALRSRLAADGDRFRRATRECLLALAAVDAMLEDGKAPREAIAGERTALLYVTAAAYGASNRAFIERRGGVTHFAYTAPAVVPAEVAIEFGVSGPYGILLGGAPATLRAIDQAAGLLDERALRPGAGAGGRDLRGMRGSLRPSSAFHEWPLVETAACLWLEPGAGHVCSSSPARGGRPAETPRGGERFAASPLADLREWLARGAGGPLELAGRWRGEQPGCSGARSDPTRAVARRDRRSWR